MLEGISHSVGNAGMIILGRLLSNYTFNRVILSHGRFVLCGL